MSAELSNQSEVLPSRWRSEPRGYEKLYSSSHYCYETSCDVRHFQLHRDSVISIFNFSVACIHLSGSYPSSTTWAINCFRDEVVVVVSGNILVQRNGETFLLRSGDNITLHSGCRYRGTGYGTAIVLVKDWKLLGRTLHTKKRAK